MLSRLWEPVWDRLVRWWWLDHLVVSLLVLSLILIVSPGTGVDALGRLSLDDRRNVYTDLLQLTALFAGFGGVIFAVFVGFQSFRVVVAQSKFGEDLLRVWLSALMTPWVSAFIIVAAKVFDRGDVQSNNEARWIALGATLLVALQLLRVVWVFYQLAHIDLMPTQPTIATSSMPARVVRRRSSELESHSPI